MRKAKLIEQNEMLFKQVQELKNELSKANEELDSVKHELVTLKNSIDCEKVTENKTPISRIEERVLVDNFDDTANSYAAKAIGRVVVAATAVTAEYAENTNTFAKDRINLVLGSAEVAKAEILNIVSSDAEISEKRVKIDGIAQEAIEYINGLKIE